MAVEKYKCVDGADRIQVRTGTYSMTNVPFQFSGRRTELFVVVLFLMVQLILHVDDNEVSLPETSYKNKFIWTKWKHKHKIINHR